MKNRASRVALLGMLFALSVVLSFVESGLSGLVPIPGVKLGLSNVIIMYCLFFFKKREALTLAVLKAFFVLLRSPVGAAMSLAGGVLSVAAMSLLMSRKHQNSELFVSICGGVFHNAGQLIAASIVLKSSMVFYYSPVLMISGIVMGLLTGILLRYLKPYMNRMFF